MAWKHRTVATELQIIGLSRDHTQAQIAALVGVSKWTVHDVQRKYHYVLPRGRSYHSAKFRYAYDEHAWGRILETLYVEQRLPIHEVARRCGLDTGTIRRRLDALGFRIRTAGESNRGRKRGPYNYRPDLPTCVTEGCAVKVVKAGEVRCYRCRRYATD